MKRLPLLATITVVGMIGCQCRMEPQASLLPAAQVGIVDDSFTGTPAPIKSESKKNQVSVIQAPTELSPGPVDRKPQPLQPIPPGTIIPKQAPPKGWTETVLFATPTLKDEDLKAAGFMMKQALHYAQMFRFVLLARVTEAPDPSTKQKRFFLYTTARGMAMDISGKDVIVTSEKTFGGDIGRFGPRILAENEKMLDQDLLQVARSYQMMLFDAQAVMLQNNKHEKMIMRHAVVVNPNNGRVSTFVWLMTPSFQPAEKAMQLLSPNFREKRLLSVKKDKFILGLPTREAFALVRIPQGTPIPWTAEMFRLANQSTYTDAQVLELSSKLLRIASRAR